MSTAAALDTAGVIERLSEVIPGWMEEWKVPGLAVAILREDEVAYSAGFGQRDVHQGLPVTTETIFAIGSTTKAFTSAAVGILVDEGKLDWDTPVRRYLPAFRLYDVVAAERATVRDILTGQTGLPRHDLAWYGSPATRQQLFERLPYLEPSADFRQIFQYQNLMYMTAGYLIEQVTGLSWEEFVRARIFEPLGMSHSSFSVEVSQQLPNVALPYAEKKDVVEQIPFRNIDAVGPAGSINSSIADMAIWLQLHLNGGKHEGRQIVSEGSLAQMHSPQMIAPLPSKYSEIIHASYGMGWVVMPYRGHNMIWHNGGIDGFYALVAFLPAERVGVIVLTNLPGQPVPEIIAYRAFDRVLGAEEAPWDERYRKDAAEAKEAAEKAKEGRNADRVEGTSPSHLAESYAGEFEHPGYGSLTIERAGGALQMTYNGLSWHLEHLHYDVFDLVNEDSSPDLKARFSTNLKGDVESVSIPFEPAVKEIVFTRVPDRSMRERSFLEQFTGEYDLMGQTVTVGLKGEALILSLPGQPEYELEPYRGREFTVKGLSGFSVQFVMDDSNAITEAAIKQPDGVYTARKRS